jgi:hypothetical protein
MPSSTSSAFLKTPISNNVPLFSSSSSKMTTSIASSAPEFSISGASSIDDSEELALYEQYLSISHARQSNPSPEMRKKIFEDWTEIQQKILPRSKSEVHTTPIEQYQQQHHHHQQQQQQHHHHHQQQTTTTSQIKPVSKFFFSYI